MSLEEAQKKYDEILYAPATLEDIKEALKDLVNNGRESLYYRPAYDPIQEGDPWP